MTTTKTSITTPWGTFTCSGSGEVDPAADDPEVTDQWTELQAAFERAGGKCQICGDPVDLDLQTPKRLKATLDHIVPVSRGGGDERANLQLAHFGCNSRKGNR